MVAQTAVINKLWDGAVGRADRQATIVPPELHIETQAERLLALDALTNAFIVQAFQKLSLFSTPNEQYSVEAILSNKKILPVYPKLLLSWLQRLEKSGLLQQKGEVFSNSHPLPAVTPYDLAAQIKTEYPDISYLVDYMQRCGDNLVEILQGKAVPLNYLFPNGSYEVVEAIYKTSVVAQYFNGVIKSALEGITANLEAGQTLKILEIGAGSGGTTGSVLPVLAAQQTQYYFTDISNLFLAKARQNFRNYRFVRYGLLDIDQNPTEQGFSAGSMDIVIASNVLHTTRDLTQTLQNVKMVLKPNGVVLLWEVTKHLGWFDITLALLDGWQKSLDGVIRTASPMLSVEDWREIWAKVGLTNLRQFPEVGAVTQVLQQHIMLVG